MNTLSIGGKPVQLNDGESLIWQGRPVQGILRNPVHIGAGAALLALGFWLAISGLSIVLGLLTALIGGYLAYFHAIVEKNRRASAYYVLTNQRVILAYSLRVLAFLIQPNTAFTLKKGRFDTVLVAADQQSNTQRSIGFGHLENGDEVYNLMQELKKNLLSSKSSNPR